MQEREVEEIRRWYGHCEGVGVARGAQGTFRQHVLRAYLVGLQWRGPGHGTRGSRG